MRFIALLAFTLGMPASASDTVPSIGQVLADPLAAYQGVWETRFCNKDFQWRVEGNLVRMVRQDTKYPEEDQYAVGSTVMILGGVRETNDRGVRLKAAFVDPRSGYRSEGQTAALTSYISNGVTYYSFNEMIRADEKGRQCGSSSSAGSDRKKSTATAEKSLVQKLRPVVSDISTSDVNLPPQGPTPNQLKYQRELEAYKARLKEIEQIKTDAAARHAANQAAAQQVIAAHDQDLERNRAEVAAANAAQRHYEEELATYRRLVALNETNADRERKVDWREAVVVCALNPNDGQGKFGNWRCDGPLQMTYAKLGSPGVAASPRALVDVSDACGGKPEAVRDLGLVGTSHLFGCSFGLHPDSASMQDSVARNGITYVPGRAVYRCPKSYSACRTQ